jgi:hypothetical protein
MKNPVAAVSAFRFVHTNGLVQIYNENSYLMAEYNENTGSTLWRRVVPASQRAAVEARMLEQYPPRKASVAPPPPPAGKKGKSAKAA